MSINHSTRNLVLPLSLLTWLLVPGLASAGDFTPVHEAEGPPAAKIHPLLTQMLDEQPEPVKTWVFFTDKGIRTQAEYDRAITHLHATYNPRAIWRRAVRGDSAKRAGDLFDERDLPVVQDYVDAVAATGARIHVISTWVNAASAWVTREQIDDIAALPCVRKLQPVARAAQVSPPHGAAPEPAAQPGNEPAAPRDRVDYGNSLAQLTQINLVTLHNEGFTGQGVIVGILDTGFHRTHEAFNDPAHPLNVIAEYDFINNDSNTDYEPGDPYGQYDHGTMILGVLGAYKPGSLVGGAYDASFILAKTEDTSDEYPAEEDNYVAGLQFIEANGADMSTASLGYIDWYTQADMDGLTCVTTIAMNTHTAAGVHHTNAAGNEYHDSDPTTSSLIAPADAFQCITVGAVDSGGTIAYFSSDGPTADGRVKPEVLARGVSTHTVSPSSDTGYTTASGTSLSTPVLACAVACLIDARPYWTVDRMRERLFETADYYVANGTFDPLYVRGYGIIDAFAAYDVCSDAGIVELDRIEYACESTMTVLINDCGLNTDDAVIDTVTVSVDSTSETGVETVLLTELEADAAEFTGSITLSEADAAGVLLVADGDTLTVTYIDADDGQGGIDVPVIQTAVVDCLPPQISNVQTIDIEPRSATVTFDADEPVRGIVYYGLSCDALDDTAAGTAYTISPMVGLSGLQDDNTYYYTVEAEDEAGNTATDDNGGACYSFTTPQVPDFFTQQFGSGFDLQNSTLVFTLSGTVDFYDGCVEPITEFPTDPTGGTIITLSDDNYATVNLTGGATVSLYGVDYGTFYIGANGYITFGAGDGDYSETLGEHFDLPRISAVYDDLSPQNGGTVSYRQLADHVAVTYENVPEYSSTGSNNFQIEMFFDGTIVISYLSCTVGDCIVGLSEGLGLDPDYFETDLSAMGNCGPKPPQAYGAALETPPNIPLTIQLQASDDGLPDPPAALDYIITALPADGSLTDPGAGLVSVVPYTLVDGGNEVVYMPSLNYVGPDSFAFKVNDGGAPPEGGDSNVAMISLMIGGPSPLYQFWMNDDPGWTCEGAWAFGVPTGGGSHNGDPTGGHTGDNVYGYNLAGDYPNSMPERFLTVGPLDCTGATDVELRFWRWLAVESPFDHARVAVSNNGSDWTTAWEATGGIVSDPSWTEMLLDISAVADEQPTVYLRWCMGTSDATTTYPGWNIDDVELWGLLPLAHVPGDMDGDGDVDLNDFATFANCFYGSAITVPPPGCTPEQFAACDMDADGDVDLSDFSTFALNFTG